MSKKLLLIIQKPIFLISIFICGIFLASLLQQTKIIFFLILLSAILSLISIFFRLKLILPVTICFLLALFYFWLFSSFQVNLKPGCENVSIASNVATEGGIAKFAVKDSQGERAFIETVSSNNLAYSDKLKLCFDDKKVIGVSGSYARYLQARYLTSEQIKNPEITFLQQGKNPLRYLYSFASFVSSVLNRLYPGDSGALAKGLILGGSQGFSASFIKSLRASGTTHLIAVSGYNVSIITIVLFQLIRQTVSRRAAIITTLIVLLSFCLLTGATASVLRASLMGFLFIFGKVIGRRGAIVNSLFVAALLMIILNPYSIWDVGFELSFMATLGLVLLEEPLRIIFERFAKLPQVILTSLTSTVAAQIFTLPILLWQFGQMSLLAPIANTLILPLVPLSMLMVALSFVFYEVLPILGTFFAGLTQVFLNYIMLVIGFFGGLSFAALTIDGLPWIYLIVLYIAIIILTIYLKKKVRKIILSEDEQSI